MNRALMASIAVALVLGAAAPQPPADDGQASNSGSFTPAPGDTKTFYDDADKITTKVMPGLVPGQPLSQVSFANPRYDVVYMRTRLLNGEILNVRIPRDHTFIVSTHGEPAICMCWHNVKPVYQCLHPDPVAVPVNSRFQFGQAGGFQKCTHSF